ncbi:MAG TPA: hypothetical protein VF814_09220 [Casimicrobiaceae bacterium]
MRHRKPIPLIEKIGATVSQAIAGLPENMRVMAKPGRYLVSDSAWLVARVTGTASRHGTRWVYLDAGAYHGLMEALGELDYDIRTDRQDGEIPCTVAGPTCDATDVIARDKLLPEDLREGDYVYIPNAGAYTTVYAARFNGFPGPETLVLQNVRDCAAVTVYTTAAPGRWCELRLTRALARAWACDRCLGRVPRIIT